MYDVICIGSATQDVFVKSNLAKIFCMKDVESDVEQRFLAFEFGSKIDVDHLLILTGGGGSNTSIGLSKLGQKVAFLGKVGNDTAGSNILKELEAENVSTDFVKTTKEYRTGYSVVLTTFEVDRTILTFRGANNYLHNEDIPWKKLEGSKWLFITSLVGKSDKLYDKLISFARSYGIKLAINPGSTQIRKRGWKGLHHGISKASIVFLNKEEAGKLTGLSASHQNIKSMLKKIHKAGAKIVVITDGKDEAHVLAGQTHYRMLPYPVKAINNLGAGDAFSSGFLAGYIKYNNIEKAMEVATANSSSVVLSMGAKHGLLTMEQTRKFISKHNTKANKIKKERV